jgi:hypothetical protein
MRDLPKYLKNDESKKELFKLNKIELSLERKESIDNDGNEYDERTLDNIWGKKYANDILRRVSTAIATYEIKHEIETPLELLKAALKKLNHENMDAARLTISDLPEARTLAFNIKKRADELESEFYHCEKDIKKDVMLLAQKHKKH